MPMLSWQKKLRALLASLTTTDRRPRIAILGIGNEWNGDDGAGVWVVRSLRRRLSEDSSLCLIEGGVGPENFTAPIRRFNPDLVLMIDAAEMDSPPGTVTLAEMEELEGFGASTHTMPPSTLASFLQKEIGCRVLLLGIQPEQLEFDQPISPIVLKKLRRITYMLKNIVSM
jgi:hydrogenase 3 maturation protease